MRQLRIFQILMDASRSNETFLVPHLLGLYGMELSSNNITHIWMIIVIWAHLLTKQLPPPLKLRNCLQKTLANN